MFGLFKKKSPPIRAALPNSIRDTLFGDMMLDEWPPATYTQNQVEPWSSFIQARELIGHGQNDQAIAIWHSITQTPGLEARHYAQAWTFLRALGIYPSPEQAKELLGIVLEVSVQGGIDYLAAYPEKTARYYNYSGAGIIWERPDESLDELISALLQAGERILQAIGPSKEGRPAEPPQGCIRLNLIAPSGLHYGQGLFSALAADPLAKPAIDIATVLMQHLIAKDRQSRQR